LDDTISQITSKKVALKALNSHGSRRARVKAITRPEIIPVQECGKYYLIAKLARGGMAEVFLAFTGGIAGFTKLLVIKRLHAHLLPEIQHVEMFMDEARLSAQLSHPHVVQTYDVGEFDGALYMAMEYLEGQSLERFKKRCWQELQVGIPHTLACKIMIDALDGLDYAHNLRGLDGTPLCVIHRDISPHNIFLTYDGTVKVLDFGIAKAANRSNETKTGWVKGKYAYMAPEQIIGDSIDQRSDIWSMGVVLRECLTGKHLFQVNNELAFLKAIVDKPIPPTKSLNPTVPDVLASIVDRALEKNRKKRYNTAAEMKEDLERYMLHQTATASSSELSKVMHVVFEEKIGPHQALKQLCLDLQKKPSLNTKQLGFVNAKLSSAYQNAETCTEITPTVTDVRALGNTPGLSSEPARRGALPAFLHFSARTQKYLWVTVFIALLATGIALGTLLTRQGAAQTVGDDEVSAPGEQAPAAPTEQDAPQQEQSLTASTAKTSGEGGAAAAQEDSANESLPASAEPTAANQASSAEEEEPSAAPRRDDRRRRQKVRTKRRRKKVVPEPEDIRTRR
jgi:serine/threonine protein kinase